MSQKKENGNGRKIMGGDVIIRFNDVSFGYSEKMPLLDEANFTVREGAKIPLMGQNGSGKSTILKLILNEISPDEGKVSVKNTATIAIAAQVMKKSALEKTIREFFEGAFREKIYAIDPMINKILDVVNLNAPLEKKISAFSGGEQARLLLAFALIQNPDILLLDEPTNNLDKAGIEHLTKFLIDYQKTVLVISHDAHFLNSFTDGVLYLDSFQKKVEQYVGDYLGVVDEIAKRIDRERRENVRLQKEISDRKEKMNFFAQKGGHMRDVARKMREAIEELENQLVQMREEDKTIKKFFIPCQDEIIGVLLELKSVSVIKNHKSILKKVDVVLKKGERLLLIGPNGIGKTTLLERLATGHAKGEHVPKGIRIGYYRQDFTTLDFGTTVYKALSDVLQKGSDEELRAHAAGFLLDSEILKTKIGSLSEGQKGLVTFAAIVLKRPGLLILDEPTNHINFRHIPVIADALNRYEGAMVLVSHVPDFVEKIRIDQTLDLEKL